MKVLFVLLTLLLSFGVQAGEPIDAAPKQSAWEAFQTKQQKEREATTPKCTDILFTGIAMTGYSRGEIDKVLELRDVGDFLARNPLSCNGIETGRPTCTGFAYLKRHKGWIADWNKDYYFMRTALDFNEGRKDIELTIRRKDARCAK